ncbi:hypothetical protein T484DRAFT_1765822 [Baffinella frigidus]|nr:hypothetical protein T484DRAFT_1765822 [Cryptophyta sp. CCMP2293]
MQALRVFQADARARCGELEREVEALRDEAYAKVSSNERIAADSAEAKQRSEGLETRLAASESQLEAETLRDGLAAPGGLEACEVVERDLREQLAEQANTALELQTTLQTDLAETREAASALERALEEAQESVALLEARVVEGDKELLAAGERLIEVLVGEVVASKDASVRALEGRLAAATLQNADLLEVDAGLRELVEEGENAKEALEKRLDQALADRPAIETATNHAAELEEPTKLRSTPAELAESAEVARNYAEDAGRRLGQELGRETRGAGGAGGEAMLTARIEAVEAELQVCMNALAGARGKMHEQVERIEVALANLHARLAKEVAAAAEGKVAALQYQVTNPLKTPNLKL